MAAKEFYWGTGRRKTAVARVRICEGSGSIIVNGKTFDTYFKTVQDQLDVQTPLDVTGTREKYDMYVNVRGGGTSGQAGAIRLGLSRALIKYDVNFEEVLRENNFLTRDARMKERKKYGRAGARKSFQFSKR